ncbi:aspartate aminotransferase family protein [Candidatus Karelsulcia muelleri]|uniref:Acetylornithine aminotransferase n=1 Tax=Candidatus Karelsulcia muelleri PSPU TaxID=1189303 RepID=A0AAD1B2M1_9FLAO|nr:aminotransferase class III-fold pyridoxal phosphate-dependent enzyme [Candidatus Karelsulcia muelleri]NJJ98635.1 aminotransferase class III-fold pyridoxal phosphate-dependent enzyme [Candidatus Karelsulcia muelleri]BAO66293.1 acetylornithine aminotransferase [Candidatus Karelsulcia muelleri PSPU]
MNLFNVYSIVDIEIIKGRGIYLYDNKNKKYFDFYGGHAVISIGHSHPTYVNNIKKQIEKIFFYSNSIKIPEQEKLASMLLEISEYNDYKVFLCNSGAEANENAIKIASFNNKKKKIIAFKNSFHGRTSGAISITDNKKIITKFNSQHEVKFFSYKDIYLLEEELKKEDTCAVISEGIQGIGGIIDPGIFFFKKIYSLCRKYNTILILDEIQSGYGRTGLFFAHQNSGIKPDIITIAKGMGNGFPIGGVIINPKFKPFNGMLGTTFGGNYLACSSGISVLEIIKNECLIYKAKKNGKIFINSLKEIDEIKEIRGRGLMLGLNFNFKIQKLINILIKNENIFVGSSFNKKIIRLLPPLTIEEKHIKTFILKLKKALYFLKNDK